MEFKDKREEQKYYLSRLQAGDVTAWNGWRNTNKNSENPFDHALVEYIQFIHVELAGKQFAAVDLSKMILPNADLENTKIERSNLSEANLQNASLLNTKFLNVDLTNADLRGATVNSSTEFQACTMDGCQIYRYTLECLSPDCGGLTVGQRIGMRIYDDVATLRNAYSGFLQWMHLFSLFAFLFPYLWFIGEQWGRAKFVTAPATEWLPLWNALGRFIFNGGVDWQDGYIFHWSFLIFLFALVYNLLRAGLLAKTKSLELVEQSSGLPAIFNMEEDTWCKIPWRYLYEVSRFGFYANLIVVLINLLHFSTMAIPLSSTQLDQVISPVSPPLR